MRKVALTKKKSIDCSLCLYAVWPLFLGTSQQQKATRDKWEKITPLSFNTLNTTVPSHTSQGFLEVFTADKEGIGVSSPQMYFQRSVKFCNSAALPGE